VGIRRVDCQGQDARNDGDEGSSGGEVLHDEVVKRDSVQELEDYERKKEKGRKVVRKRKRKAGPNI